MSVGVTTDQKQKKKATNEKINNSFGQQFISQYFISFGLKRSLSRVLESF